MKKIFIILFCLILDIPVFAYKYDFSDDDYRLYKQKYCNITVPENQIIESRLNANISSDKNQKNDILTTQLISDWIYQGKIIAPENSLIIGKIQSVNNATYATTNGQVKIEFYQVVRPDGVIITIVTKPIIIKSGESRLKNAGTKMLSGVIGMLPTINNSTNLNDSLSAITVGATLGGIDYVSTKGQEIVIPFGTKFRINIKNPIQVSIYEY